MKKKIQCNGGSHCYAAICKGGSVEEVTLGGMAGCGRLRKQMVPVVVRVQTAGSLCG